MENIDKILGCDKLIAKGGIRMLKIEYRINTQKMKEEGLYEPQAILARLDRAFLQFGFRKEILEDGTVCFWGSKKRDDYAHFGALINALKKKSWFTKYADKWLWYNSDGQRDETCYSVEDILYYVTQRRSA